MKLTAIILLAACIAAGAEGHSQTITLSEKDAPLLKIFKAIEQQTDFVFFGDFSLLQKAKTVTIEVKSISLKEALDICFKGQQLSYSIVGKNIIINFKSGSNDKAGDVEKQKDLIDIKGRVLNDEDDPVAGVTIMIKGTNIGTATDLEGKFSLNKVERNGTLFLTSVNIQPLEVNINGRSELILQVKNKTGKLDEVQVIAYGKTSQRYSVGNVTTIKAVDIEKQPINNPLLALQGRVPGLFITQTNGLSGGGVKVRIQGQNSIGNGNDPLYVIDGVPFSSQMLRTTLGGPLGSSGAPIINSKVEGGGGNPLSYLNPNDIESIDILKDADATAIYGSRAANGAILITTKRGKSGETKVDINIQNGYAKVSRKLDLLTTPQFLQMRREAFVNDNASVGPFDFDLNGVWDTTRNSDWQDLLIGGTAKLLDAQATVSGGNTSTQFLVGGGYHRESTVFPMDFLDNKASLHFNLRHTSFNQKLSIQLTGNYLDDNNKLPQTDKTLAAIYLSPNAPLLYAADGSINWMSNSSGAASWMNPIADMYNKYQNKTTNLIGNSVISYALFDGFQLRASLGYNSLNTNEFSANPEIAIKPQYRQFIPRSAIYSNSSINSWIIEPQLKYKRNLNFGDVDFLIGASFQETKSSGQAIAASGFNSDLVIGDIMAANSLFTIESLSSIYKYNAGFGRLNYTWRNKYHINVTCRRDGSSRFGPSNKFNNFWSIGSAWIFSEEEFIDKLKFLSFGKVRASYGTTGSDQIGDYRFLNLYSPANDYGILYQNTPGLTITGLPNPYLEWEETKKLQVGLDLGFLKDNVLLNLTYSRNRSSNQLLSNVLPIPTGFRSITENLPATVQNTSWEFSLSLNVIKSKNFSWTSNLNLTIPDNKLIQFENLSETFFASSMIIGQPISIKRVFHSLGVDASTGEYVFADIHGNATKSPSRATDLSVTINTLPKFYGGFQNAINYKEFNLEFLFQLVKQTGPKFISNMVPGSQIYDIGYANQPIEVLDRWQKSGDKTQFPRFSQNFDLYNGFENASNSDLAYGDASYIRLKNVSCSWQIPSKWITKVHLKSGRIFVNAQNLLTITNYKGLDPETTSSTTLPPLRVISTGIRISL